MPGHALLGSQYTATSMIGMIALAGIIVRNLDPAGGLHHLQVRAGAAFADAIVHSAITARATNHVDRRGSDAGRVLHSR